MQPKNFHQQENQMANLILSSLPMFVCGFWVVMIALNQYFDGRNKARMMLMLFMAVATLLYAGHCVFLNRFYSNMPLFDSLYAFSNLAVYPMFYLYIDSMTSSESHLRRTWWYLVPAVVIGIIVSTIYTIMSPHDIDNFVRIISYKEDYGSGTGLCRVMGLVRFAAKIIFAIEVVTVLVAGSRKISAYNKSIEAYYADTEGKRLVVYQWYMYIFTACSVASIIFNFLGRYRFVDSTWTIAIPSLTFSSLLYILGFISLRQTFTIENFVQEEAEDASISENLPDCESENSLARRIEEVVTQQQLFLRHNVKVSDIAAELFTNRLYVSTAINDEIGVSFSDYINKKRIDYAIQLMRTNPQMTMCEIADRSGFSSDKSFYRNFKRFTGKSPKKIDE